jgi:putative ABC transport system permease protein
MWWMVLRDLQWRRRRFVLAGLATALVFAVTLLLTGVSTAVHAESHRAVDRFGADRWLVADGSSGGPFTGATGTRPSDAGTVEAVPGVTRADAVLVLRGALPGPPAQDVNLLGLTIGGLGQPALSKGRALAHEGEAVVGTGLGLDVGDVVTVAGRRLHVVGVAPNVAFTFGVPTVFLPLLTAQQVALGGAPVASAFVVKGVPSAAVPGYSVLTNRQVFDDLERPLSRGTDSIDLIRILLTITAAGIVGLIVYLSTLERTADLAVLKATGSSRRFMAAGLAAQAVLLSIAAAAASVGLAAALAPTFPVPLEVRGATYLELLVLAVAVGLLASLAGVWRAVRVDPVDAFGGR